MAETIGTGAAGRTRARVVALALGAALHAVATPAIAQPRPSGAHAVTLIDRGRELFEDQRYEESIQVLSGALVRPNSTKEQRLEMYHLLALDHITLGDDDEADSFVRALLALRPDYELAASESPRFREFFARVRQQWEAEGRPGILGDESAQRPVQLRHRSPSSATREAGVLLTAQVDDPDHRVTSVKLYFRVGTTGKFSEETTQYDAAAGSVRGRFPASAVRPPFVTYYLLAKDKNGVPLASSGDADAPLRLPVPDADKGWLFPLAISGGLVAAAGIVVGSLALAGAFK
jgi:hypothetical protein